MTLVEMDRLIRRIEEAMERPPTDGVLPRLASDYVAACRAANQRLHQCAAMLAAGDEHQAIQLAEAAPALLDQLTLLAFRRSPNFRALCQAQNLPVPENFEIKSVRQINELYAKAIDKDHALYREYRRAIVVNDSPRALAVLRSITRLNPNDKNAATELARLEQKFRADKIHKLEHLVRHKAPARDIAALAEELETIPEAQQSPAWIPAQTIRGAFLVDQARDAQRAAEVGELQRILAKIPNVAHLLTESDRESVDELERWSAADAARRKEAASRRAAILQLTDTVSRIEQEQITPRKRRLQELRNSSDALERAWRQVEHFRAEIAGDISTRTQKLRDTLLIQIDRRVRASRRLAFAGVAFVVLFCIAGAWAGYTRQSANALARRIEMLISERRVGEVQAALPSGRNVLKSHDLMRAKVAAIKFLVIERALKTTADEAMTRVAGAAGQSFTNAPPAQIAAAFEKARQAIAALAPDYRSEMDAALKMHESEWREVLDVSRSANAAQVAELLTPIESTADRELQYSRPPAEVSASAAALKRQLEPVQAIVDAPIPELRPKQETLFRFKNLEARIDRFSKDATNWFAAQQQLTAATNLAQFSGALQLLASNGFTPQAHRASIATLAGSNLSGQNLLAPILLPNAPAAALTSPRVSRVPDEILPAEREILRRLREDENIHNVSRLQIEVKSLPGDDPRRRRIVFLRGELQRRITRRFGQIYDPIENPTALQFTAKEMSSLDYTVEEPAATPERELFDRAELTRLIDSNTGEYQTSLLQSLDEINGDRRASPVFRAWLFLQLCRMIDAQPAEWSAIFSPSFPADRAALERLGARQINTGDWFIPTVNAQRAAALNAHFDRAALHSYLREATFFKRLLPQAAAAGLRVIGYINAEGQPVINETRAFNSVYALTAPNQPPQLIFTRVSPNDRSQPLLQGMPYSPLFVFAGNASELITTTLQALGYAPAAVNIPQSLPPILRPAQ